MSNVKPFTNKEKTIKRDKDQSPGPDKKWHFIDGNLQEIGGGKGKTRSLPRFPKVREKRKRDDASWTPRDFHF